MYKFKKSLSLLLIFCIIVSCVLTTSFAGQPEQDVLPNSINVESTVGRASEMNVDSVAFEKERIVGTLRNNDAEMYFTKTLNANGTTNNSNDDFQAIENLFDCSLEVTTAHQILDTTTENKYTRFVCEDKTEVSFTEDGDLFKVSTIYGDTLTNQSSMMSIKEMQNICLDLMPDLYRLFNIEKEYVLTDAYDFDEDYLFFTFEKMLANGVANPFQSINVVFNKDTLKFSIAVKFDSNPNAIDPQISAGDAISVANEYTADGELLNSAELTYISDRTYNTKVHQYDGDICYLVYEVSSPDNNSIIFIDALTGEYVGRDLVMAEIGYAVAIQESANSSAYNYNSDMVKYSPEEIEKYNAWRIDKMNWAASAMRRLGYTSTSSSFSTSVMISNVKNYLKAQTNEYAFYFSGHGSTTLLGFKDNGWIRPSDVTGNWHFVFLDACGTAENTGWADAFKINGYSNRAYLGWNGSIRWDYGYQFAQGFWPLINGTNTVRQAAVDAAALVPGAGTTPIKFYGDLSYTGRAWS